MDVKRLHKRYELSDLSTVFGRGRYRARVPAVRDSSEETRSQRFVDFETSPSMAFASMDVAQTRANDGAASCTEERPKEQGRPLASIYGQSAA